jgi:two-component sensor histidine kinase
MKINLRIEEKGSFVEINNESITISVKDEGLDFNVEARWEDIKQAGTKLMEVLDHHQTLQPYFGKDAATILPTKVQLSN